MLRFQDTPYGSLADAASGDMDAGFPMQGLLGRSHLQKKISNSGVVFGRQFPSVHSPYSARIGWYMALFRNSSCRDSFLNLALIAREFDTRFSVIIRPVHRAVT